MSFDTVPPEAHPSITPDLVRELIAAQHPEFSYLDVGPRFDGWDAAMFRLGDGLAARLPRTADAVRFLVAETTWLPRISMEWNFPFPRFVARGLPGGAFPWPWAVVTWVRGDTADAVPLAADAGAAVGAALAQVHRAAPADAPINIEQSVPMASRTAKVRERVERLAAISGPGGGRLSAAACEALWLEALAAPEPGRDGFVWSHADMHGANVLSLGGVAGQAAFGGIVDWGSMAACDPAVDVGFVYLLTSADGVAEALAAYGAATGRVDAAFEARARGVGLSKALNVALHPRPVSQAMGWRGLVALGVAA